MVDLFARLDRQTEELGVTDVELPTPRKPALSRRPGA